MIGAVSLCYNVIIT